ncbi:3-mercaptopyruvate sulfurtransferase [Ensifer soli]|uniref:3-mercaptopyruvate sulfurtransferase n=1 Tax=Ciceribacter sp. sgz301302 TaxID=3342379 RepID=UPI0035B9768E
MTSTDTDSRFIVSADWLDKRLGDGALRIVDASWYLPAQGRDARAEFAAAHIPGAVFFDQDRVVDPDSALPHTIPPAALFAAEAGRLGLSADVPIVVYDGPGYFSAPRAWWLFRTMGARQVYVLDGGFDGWRAEGRPVTDAVPAPGPAVFEASFDHGAVVRFEAMRAIVDGGTRQIADARGPGRFTGAEAEPRAGVRSGHMPGARNLPYAAFSEKGRFKDAAQLRAVFAEAGIDLEKPIVTSCGSGVTAAVITLALQSLGHTENGLYDGSWSEWGGRSDTPVATGTA